MKALILTGKLATWEEYIYALHRLREEGCEPEVAVRDKETVYGELKGPAGLVQAGPIVPTVEIADLLVRQTIDVTTFHDEFRKFVPGSMRGCFEYDLLILPGGAKAMEYLRQDREIVKFIAGFHNCGGVIASICHGAQLLISAGLVKGRRIAGYYSIRDDIENAGGTFVDGVCSDDRIVTAPHYKFNGPWMKAALEEVRRVRG